MNKMDYKKGNRITVTSLNYIIINQNKYYYKTIDSKKVASMKFKTLHSQSTYKLCDDISSVHY